MKSTRMLWRWLVTIGFAFGFVAGLLVQSGPLGAVEMGLHGAFATAHGVCGGRSGSGDPNTIQLQGNIDNSLVAPVCIDGKGPFHLLVDTGADATALDSSASLQLGLPPSGPPEQFFGIGRPLNGFPARVRTWSLGNIRLQPQVIFAMHLDLPDRIDGLLGSDVLSRFGVIRLDYDSAELIVDGPEGSPSSTRSVAGASGTALPPTFARYQPEALVPISVTNIHGASVAVAAVTIDGKSVNFEIDSGSNSSTITPAMVAGLGLAQLPGRVPIRGIGSAVKAREDRVGSWTLGPVRLVPQDLLSVGLPSLLGEPKVDGLLGADVLSQFRAVTIDYADGTLALDQVPVV